MSEPEACPLACDAEVLAGEAAGPEGCTTPCGLLFSAYACWAALGSPVTLKEITGSLPTGILCDRHDVTEVRDSGPSLGEDGAGVGVDLGEGDGAPAGTLKPKVKSTDA